jgi:geranylgeranyl pyrophosphate synthase
MDRATYFDELRKTSDVVKPIIARWLTAYREQHGEMYGRIFHLAEERTKKTSLLLKPLLVRLSYETSGGCFWESISPICAAAELINISSYQANLAFDGKLRSRSPEDKTGQFIASMLTREAVSDIIHDISGTLSHAQAEIVLHGLAESNKQIYVGQYYDLAVLTCESLNLLDDFDRYLKLYLFRCQSLSGTFSGQCAVIGGVLADADADKLSGLEAFGKNFGIGLHIVNDLGDFAPRGSITNGSLKESCDQFSDIRKGKLTLPVMYVLKYGNPAQRKIMRELLGRGDACHRDLIAVSRIVVDSGAFAFSKGLAKEYMRKAKLALRVFPPGIARSLLSVMASQVRSNKYFAALRSLNHE